LKKSLVTVVTESLAPIQDRFNQIRYSDELLDILRDGSKRAGEIAEPVLERVKDRFGLGI
jgi:tryptophanyl-tRNA synthetase